IVCLKDAAGNATYQVLTAKPCTIEIEHSDRPGSAIYQPGDKIQVHFSGLRHPANKLAGIYNMSAYVTYNDIPNGTSLILSPNQYTFGSSASAQTVTVDVPADFDTEASPSIDMTDGVIQVNGYGDPIGNHRNISPTAGRSPNFTAIAHKTYFGQLPNVSIPVSARREFEIAVSGLKEDSKLSLSFAGTELTPDAEGIFSGTYGSYDLVAKTPGYRCFRETYTIADDAEGLQTFVCDLEKASATAWDGVTLDEPAVIDGVYQISTGNELAWFAAHVNEGNYTAEAILTADIDLAGYDWTPIGGTTLAKSYQGEFNGAGHTVSGLYIGRPTATYQAMFAYSNASISNLTVEGSVAGKQYVAGIAAYLGAKASIDRCVSDVTLTATGNYVGGITASTLKGSTVTNCINRGDVLGLKYVAGVVGFANATVENCYNIGSIAGDGVGACLNGNTTTVTAESARNIFCTEEYIFTTGQTLVSEAQMASGEVAYLLGDAFGQVIGVDPYPVIGGAKVYLTDEGHYANTPSGVEEVESDIEWISIFGIDGTPRASLQQGLNIIVYPDGTSRKVMIK
ncbi:MAG: hypothetical protein K2L83_05560, partial [Muribaculaceae bacterium]|nr:hypothetical protein [Muribaculaceae bacterium]